MSKLSTATRRLVIGRPFRSDKLAHTLLPKRIALPVFASDALSSVAYAPEEIFLVLSVAGLSAAICALEGVDVAFIGVNDLAGSIGRLEQLDHPDVRALVRRAEEVILASGKPMGTVPNAGASWRELFERGYQMVAGPHDLALLRDAARRAVQDYAGFRDGTDSAGQAPPAPSRSY